MHLLVQIAAASQFGVAPATTARTVATQAVADDVALTSRRVPIGIIHLRARSSVPRPVNGERPVVGGTAGRLFLCRSS